MRAKSASGFPTRETSCIAECFVPRLHLPANQTFRTSLRAHREAEQDKAQTAEHIPGLKSAGNPINRLLSHNPRVSTFAKPFPLWIDIASWKNQLGNPPERRRLWNVQRIQVTHDILLFVQLFDGDASRLRSMLTELGSEFLTDLADF
jgi:hypothetical protein